MAPSWFESPMFESPISRRVLLAGAGGAGLASLLAACSGSGSGSGQSASRATTATPVTTPSDTASSASPSASASPSTSTSASARATHAATKLVRVTSAFGDGTVVGVGLPIVLSFDPTPTDAKPFVDAVTVTVDGKPADGAWYWSKPYAGEPVQAHYRMRDYWPANSTIVVTLPIGGLSAGKGLAYRDELTSITWHTGDKRVVLVNGATETAVVSVNDKQYRTMKASLGKSETPTTTGTKLVMQKGETQPGTNHLRPDGAVRMQNTAHTYDLIVDWSVRVTASGEYLHAAPWNSEIGQTSTSDGCTNLSVADAKWFYGFCRIGDVVIHRNTGGQPVQWWDGYADWNTPWSTWVKGGLLPPT